MADLEAVTTWRKLWLGQDSLARSELDSVEPWSLPLVVRSEKASPPSHQAAVHASARAVVGLLAHPDAAPGGPWHAPLRRWSDGWIRKVVRRARTIRWTETIALPGVTSEVAGAEVRALLPHPVSEPPATVAKLQVAGLDLEADPDWEPLPATDLQLTILLAPGLTLTTGKACAQVGHAAQLALLELDEAMVAEWVTAGFPLRVRAAESSVWQQLLRGRLPAAVVRDAGFTEVAPGTFTCAATFAKV
ncbi:peptidyl-tRNA hydrolase [Flindersiella endophytica]